MVNEILKPEVVVLDQPLYSTEFLEGQNLYLSLHLQLQHKVRERENIQ